MMMILHEWRTIGIRIIVARVFSSSSSLVSSRYGKAAAAGNEYAKERLGVLLGRHETPLLLKHVVIWRAIIAQHQNIARIRITTHFQIERQNFLGSIFSNAFTVSSTNMKIFSEKIPLSTLTFLCI